MPVFRNDGWQLIVLLLAVPLQIIILYYSGSSSISRDYAFHTFMSHLTSFKVEYLEWKSWTNWCSRLFAKISDNSDTSYGDDEDSDMGESPAIEVMKYRDKDGHFGSSFEPRSPRQPSIKYRIGQVIKHKRFGYRGVIIGWDEKARAPEEWIKEMHGGDKEWRTKPNYAILVDTRDRAVAQMTYVVEENIEIVTNVQVLHPSLINYFEKYDGTQYIPRPWLKTIYPYD
ncbi:Uncharacterised protein g215 [Pycnogonum litorale]